MGTGALIRGMGGCMRRKVQRALARMSSWHAVCVAVMRMT
jgi:hypothetical protein